MSGYVAVPDAAWELLEPLVVAQYAGRAWPRELVIADLRGWLGRRWTGSLDAADFPTVRALAERWGWGRDAADRFVRDVDAWQDAGRRMDLLALRGDRRRTRIGQESDNIGHDPDSGHGTTPTLSTAPGQNRTGAGQESDSRAANSARSTLHPSPQGGSTRTREPPALAPPGTAAEPGDPGPPPEDLPAYLGLALQAAALALVRAGVTSRTELLACTLDELRHTRGAAGATARRVLARIAAWGDRLAEEQPRERGPPRAVPLRTEPAPPPSAPPLTPADEALVHTAADRILSEFPPDIQARERPATLEALRRDFHRDGRASVEAVARG